VEQERRLAEQGDGSGPGLLELVGGLPQAAGERVEGNGGVGAGHLLRRWRSPVHDRRRVPVGEEPLDRDDIALVGGDIAGPGGGARELRGVEIGAAAVGQVAGGTGHRSRQLAQGFAGARRGRSAAEGPVQEQLDHLKKFPERRDLAEKGHASEGLGGPQDILDGSGIGKAGGIACQPLHGAGDDGGLP
jgi:hypothetical protein